MDEIRAFFTAAKIGTIIEFLIYCIACGLITKYINERKGYVNGFAWGAWLGILGIIIVACKPNKNKAEQELYKTNNEKLHMLDQLAELHKKGIITDSEYEEKKSDIMRNI